MPPVTIDGSLGITTPMYNGSITANAVTPSVNMKNRIINGAMVIDQRNAGASVTPTNGQYLVDRWQGWVGATASKYTAQQSSTVPAGFVNSLKFTSSSAFTPASGDLYGFTQIIEGYNVADLNWGTANAKTVTLSFWVNSSVSGQFGGSFYNDAQTRFYPFSYTITSANTWQQISITIAGDTSGTWLTTNGRGIIVTFGLATGSTYQGTAGSWGSTQYYNSTGSTNLLGTNGATFYITGVQLEVGSTATSFDYRPYGTELQLCQRYYAKMDNDGSGGDCTLGVGMQQSTTGGNICVKYPVKMRVEPTASATSLQLTNLRSFSSNATLTSISPTYDTANVSFSMGSNGATDAPVFLQITNNVAGFLAFSAEL